MAIVDPYPTDTRDTCRTTFAADVLNATRQTGGVLGVILFGGLVGRSGAFIREAGKAFVISAVSPDVMLVVAEWREGFNVVYARRGRRSDELDSRY